MDIVNYLNILIECFDIQGSSQTFSFKYRPS